MTCQVDFRRPWRSTDSQRSLLFLENLGSEAEPVALEDGFDAVSVAQQLAAGALIRVLSPLLSVS